VISAPVQTALMQPPNNFIPVNRDVKLAGDLPMASLDEMAKFVRHDWSKINPLRAPGSSASTRKSPSERAAAGRVAARAAARAGVCRVLSRSAPAPDRG